MEVVGERKENNKKELFCHWASFKDSWNEWKGINRYQFKVFGSESVDCKWWPKITAKRNKKYINDIPLLKYINDIPLLEPVVIGSSEQLKEEFYSSKNKET
eukprot:UN12844